MYRRNKMPDTKQTHPDEVARALRALAAQHGYGLVAIDLIGKYMEGGIMPEYSYRSTVTVASRMDGGAEIIMSDTVKLDG